MSDAVMINNEVILNIDSLFHEEGEDDIVRRLGLFVSGWRAYDRFNDYSLSLNWTKASFKNSFTDPETVLKGVEESLSRSLSEFSRRTNYNKYPIRGQTACGFSFTYQEAQAQRVSEVFLFRYKKKFYLLRFDSGQSNVMQGVRDYWKTVESIALC